MINKISRISTVLLIFLLSFLIILKPEVCKNGAFSGLLISGKIIIPSLFPFTMCVLFIARSGIFKIFEFMTPFLKKSTGLNANETVIMILSFIGGYPVGAKLLDNAVAKGEMSPKRAGTMLNFCVNAGPAFIVTAVGSGILNSQKCGYILLLCHILSSFLILFVCGKKLRAEESGVIKSRVKSINASDNFVLSAAEASATVLSICGFVIIFSVINAYVDCFSENFIFLKWVSLILEVTNSVAKTNNFYIIAFLLGFSGICVWCQILSVSEKIKISVPRFILYRIFHGILSTLLLYSVLKIFKVTLETSAVIKREYIYSTPIISISLLLMCIVFAISVVGKKYSGKILEDVI